MKCCTKISTVATTFDVNLHVGLGMQWINGRVLDYRQRGRGFEPHRRHCVVSLSKNINGSTQEDPSLYI